jgi:uncharacterized protein (TIGR03067 family)
LPAKQIAEIRKALREEHFFQLKEYYGPGVIHGGWDTLTVIAGDRVKQVRYRSIWAWDGRRDREKLAEAAPAVRVWLKLCEAVDPDGKVFEERRGVAKAIAVAEEGVVRARMRQPAKTDLTLLQGTWTLVAVERDGKESSEKEISKLKRHLVIRGDSFQITRAPSTLEGIIRLDPTASPKAITFDAVDIVGKGKLDLRGIYRLSLEGDTLTLCLADAGTPRPTDFRTTDKDGRRLERYKRTKP